MLEYNQTLTKTDLHLTDTALEKIGDLIRDTNGDANAVRIYVSGGGCSGMGYGMTFTAAAEPTDSILQGDTHAKLVVDPVARSFLAGAEIDYVDDGVNATFMFNDVFQAVGGSGACGGCGGGGT